MNRPDPRAGDLARALGRARDLAAALAHARDDDLRAALARPRDSDLDLRSDLGRVRELVRSLARARDRALGHILRADFDGDLTFFVHDDARHLAADLVRALERDGRAGDAALGRDLYDVLDNARALARALDRVAATTAPDLARPRPLAGEAAAIPGRSADVVRAAVRAAEPTVRAAPAERVAGAAVRLLPARDRARYSEEYRSELWELAAGGEPRRRQVLFAVRLLRTAPVLRLELRALRRQKASP